MRVEKIIGDPKNIKLTERARSLGWSGPKSDYDILPIMISIKGGTPYLFNLPEDVVLEVPIQHPDSENVAKLGMRWFALPAVANMALDLGGVVYNAAPSNGFYMETEIGSFNLADPRRYNKIPELAEVLGLDTTDRNPLWRDRAMVELNRAVLFSFQEAGIRILDYHALSEWFDRFRKSEKEASRPVFGHWPWIVPPLSANLFDVWHDKTLKNIILKPGYFYPKSDSLSLVG